MDIDFLRSISEDPTDMMMLMNLDKLPDFTGVYADDHNNNELLTEEEISSTSTSTSTNMINPNMSYLMEDHLKLVNPNGGTISFASPSEAPSGKMQLLSSPRWRNGGEGENKRHSMAAMREMIFRIAAMQPIHIDPEAVKPPKRRNVKISKDPQSVAARHRRERISEKIRILQRLVPGGTKMDTASMLDEAIHYVKFLKNQVHKLEKAGESTISTIGSGSYALIGTPSKGYQQSPQNVHYYLGA